MKESVQNNQEQKEKDMPFLEHIAELRTHLIRAVIGVVVGALVVGIFWGYFETLIMAPLSSDFITYQIFNQLGNTIGMGDIFDSSFNVQTDLTNLEFGGQFTAMIGVIMVGGIILALPYVVYEIFRFIEPGMTSKEKKYSVASMLATVFFFLLGVFFAYFLVMPLSINFMYFFQPFGVSNNWKLLSYINVFVQTILAMGIVFLLPVFVYFLTKMGMVTPSFLTTYRKHAFVVVLTLAAFITPADLLSMFVAAVPLWGLYEFSIWVSRWAVKSTSDV